MAAPRGDGLPEVRAKRPHGRPPSQPRPGPGLSVRSLQASLQCVHRHGLARRQASAQRDFLEGGFRRGMVVDSSPQEVCNRGGFPEPATIECLAMPTIPQRIASAFAILFGQYGDVTKMAHDRERSRQSLYREAQQAIDAVDGTAAQARVAELEQQGAQLRSQVHDLQRRLGRAVEMTPERQAELACVAQAEGVSLPVARRILQVLLPPKARSVPTLGRATAEAGRRAGRVLEVLAEATCPRVAQATADEIFSAANPDLVGASWAKVRRLLSRP